MEGAAAGANLWKVPAVHLNRDQVKELMTNLDLCEDDMPGRFKNHGSMHIGAVMEIMLSLMIKNNDDLKDLAVNVKEGGGSNDRVKCGPLPLSPSLSLSIHLSIYPSI